MVFYFQIESGELFNDSYFPMVSGFATNIDEFKLLEDYEDKLIFAGITPKG